MSTVEIDKTQGFPCGSAGKESACNVGDLGSIPGLGRSPGEGIGYPLQYSGLENSMDCTVHGIAKSRTQLTNFHFHFRKWKVQPWETSQSKILSQGNLIPLLIAKRATLQKRTFSIFMRLERKKIWRSVLLRQPGFEGLEFGNKGTLR